jgi:hypothetical protein
MTNMEHDAKEALTTAELDEYLARVRERALASLAGVVDVEDRLAAVRRALPAGGTSTG